MAGARSRRSGRSAQQDQQVQQGRRGEITIRLAELARSAGVGGGATAPEGASPRFRDPETPGREIQKRLLQLPGAGYARVVLDFEGLASVGSATLGAILLLRQSLVEEGCALVLRGCSEPLQTTLEILCVNSPFPPGAGGARAAAYWPPR